MSARQWDEISHEVVGIAMIIMMALALISAQIQSAEQREALAVEADSEEAATEDLASLASSPGGRRF